MKSILLFFALTAYNFNATQPGSLKIPSDLNTIKNYLKAKQQAWQENATKEDVEKLLDFCSDSLYYEARAFCRKKFTFHGKDDLRIGYISHLGETRNVKIELINSIEKQNIVVAEYSIIREIIATGEVENNRTVSFFEFDSNAGLNV